MRILQIVPSIRFAGGVDAALAEEGWRRRTPSASIAKVDVFVRKDRPFDVVSLARGSRDTIRDDPDAPALFVASPEDMIHVKLEWFEKGAESPSGSGTTSSG